MKPFIILIALVAILASSCNSSSDSFSSASTPSYQEVKMTLEQKEQMNPTDFLTADGTYRKNFWGQWVLEGNVTSTASVATYKDVVLKINFFSKTETLIGSEEHPIYEYVPAGNSKHFKIKLNGYKDAVSVGWDVASASAAN